MLGRFMRRIKFCRFSNKEEPSGIFIRTAGGIEERSVDVEPRPGLALIDEMSAVEGERVPDARSCWEFAAPA